MFVPKESWWLLFFCVFSIDGRQLDKIVGGSDAENKEFPYQASLRSLDSHICGASVIHERFILTAAHCLYQQDITTLTVVLGSNQLSIGGDRYYPKELIIDENFQPNISRNDVGLIKLNSSIIFKENVKKVELATRNTPAGTECVLTGWGQTSASSPLSDKLQKITVVTICLAKCKAAYGALNETKPDNGSLCTFPKVGKGACFGDSGGPLVNIATKQQVGVVSHGTPCGVGEPDIYTNVFKYRNWIIKKLRTA